MKKFRCFDISWDADDDDIDLPTEVIIEVEDDFDPIDDAADHLANEFGWCVFDLNIEAVEV